MGLDNRIGRKFLHPGPGFGGSCFPKDTRALVQVAEQVGCDLRIVKATIEVNERQRQLMIDKIKNKVGDLKGKVIGVLGLSFKPNTDDMREAPSITIISALLKEGATVKAYDPAAMEEAKKILKDVHYCKETYEVAKDADALVFLTEWNQFRSLDLDRLKKLLRHPVVIDLRNIYEPDKMREKGFDYVAVGR